MTSSHQQLTLYPTNEVPQVDVFAAGCQQCDTSVALAEAPVCPARLLFSFELGVPITHDVLWIAAACNVR